MYKWNAQEYAKSSFAQELWATGLIAKLHLKGNERILDIGCGDGRITAAIAEQVPNGSVVGIDSSAEMIDFSRSNFPATAHPNLSFELMDASALTFNGEFDVVFSSSVLHWVTDHQPVLAGIKRSLKPGGRILLQMGGKGNAAEMFASFEALRKAGKWDKYFANFSAPWNFCGPDEYKRWLAAAGFKNVRAELVPKDMAQKGKDGLAGWVRTTWLPYVQRLPDTLREEFVNELVGEYLACHPLDKEGNAHLKMVRLEVEAE
ncbi:MAG TPA: methyltransferase domain-containing protein [Candidatus Sulfotelmatobacter sp.]|nr:methyltransferase domain-containing protein [Candidatus Sulfotelmatobacter sp.]